MNHLPSRPATDRPRALPEAAAAGLPGLRRRHLLAAGGPLALGTAGPLALGAALPLGWPWPAWAGVPGVDVPPVPLAPRPLQLPPMALHRLANGLTVVTVSRHDAPIVSASLLLRVGAHFDPPGRPGVASMLASVLPKGARRQGRAVSATELARQAEALGNALVSDNDGSSISLSMSVLSNRLPAALALMADVLREPLLQPEELERARAQALDALRLALGSPAEVSAMALRRLYWGDTPYGNSATAATLARIEADDLRRFHGLHARPELAALVLAGDVTPEQAALLAQRLLGDWEAAGALLPRAPSTPPRPLEATLVLLDMPGSDQASVALAAPFVAQGAADRRIGQVANAVLGGDHSSRLNRAVRIERGLSYGAFSDVESAATGGLLALRAQTRHGSAAEVLALMQRSLRELAQAPPGADELAARQASLVGGFARRLQTTGGLVGLAAGQLVAGRPLAALPRYPSEIMAVSPAQVQAFARQHWAPERWRAVVAGDLTAAGDSLGPAAQPAALRLPVARFDPSRPGLTAAD